MNDKAGGTLCRTKIHQPEIFLVLNWKWHAVQLPS